VQTKCTKAGHENPFKKLAGGKKIQNVDGTLMQTAETTKMK